MFYLCTVEATDLSTVFGKPGFASEEPTPPKYENLQTIMLGQKSDCSGYLLFSNQVVQEFTQQFSVPNGYDFIFRQEWGLTINEEILHRVISTLRSEAYPPMADYLDAKVKNDTAQEEEYIAKCLAVKAKYPKFSF
jgi:hypothetical protein